MRTLCRPSGPQSENHRKQKERLVLRTCKRTEKAMEHEDDGDTNCNLCTRKGSKRLDKGAGKVGNERTR